MYPLLIPHLDEVNPCYLLSSSYRKSESPSAQNFNGKFVFRLTSLVPMDPQTAVFSANCSGLLENTRTASCPGLLLKTIPVSTGICVPRANVKPARHPRPTPCLQHSPICHRTNLPQHVPQHPGSALSSCHDVQPVSYAHQLQQNELLLETSSRPLTQKTNFPHTCQRVFPAHRVRTRSSAISSKRGETPAQARRYYIIGRNVLDLAGIDQFCLGNFVMLRLYARGLRFGPQTIAHIILHM